MDSEVFEAAVSVAASLAMSEQQNDALLDLMFVAHEAHQFTTGRGVDHMPHLQEVLAAVQIDDTGSFEQLQQAVTQHLKKCSSLFCVLLHWDQERQDFIQTIRTYDIPIAVFVVHGGDLVKQELANQPEHFYLINAQQIAEDLAAL